MNNKRTRPYHIRELILLFCFLFGIANMAFGAPPLQIKGNPPNGTQYEPYTTTITGKNGTTPYTWTLIAGSLPPGLALVPAPSPSLTADISGTPIQVGSFTFTLLLTDNSAPMKSVSNAFTVTISAGNCTFVGTTTGGISFNIIDPSVSPGPILGTVTQQIPFTCKAGMAYTVTANPASGWMIGTIPYAPGFIATGTGLGAMPIDLLTTNSQILQADYANAVAGLHSNSQPITLTISWAVGGGGSIVATIPAGSVSGTVINICAVSQSPGTLTFAIDPSVPGITNATVLPDMQIQCTRNDTVTITALSKCGGAAPRLDTAYPACGGVQIPYTFNFTPNITGQGFGMGIPLNIGGSANSANYENAPVGNYGDLQTLTITY